MCGLEMVTLCAVGLGKSTVAAMKDRVRLQLPSRIKLKADTLGRPILRKLADEYSRKGCLTSGVEAASEETHTVAETQTPAPAPASAPEPEPEPDARQTEQADTQSETVDSGRRK